MALRDRFLGIPFQINTSKNSLRAIHWNIQGAELVVFSKSAGFNENAETANVDSLCCRHHLELYAKAAVSICKFSCVDHL